MNRVVIVAALVVLSFGLVRANDADNRRALLKAFDDLKKANMARLEKLSLDHLAPGDNEPPPLPRDFHAGIKPVSTPLGDSRFIVKVWARRDSDKKSVSLTQYRWAHAETFHLWIETATPARLGLYYVNPKKNKDQRVLPKIDLKDKSRQLIPPGVYEIPMLLETEKDDTDERGYIILMAEGTTDNPRPQGTPDRNISFLGEYLDKMDEVFLTAKTRKLTFRGLAVEETSTKSVSDEPKDVALTLATTETKGLIEFVLKKK